MKQEKLNAYSTRITQANKSELVVISYEIIIDSFLSAKEAFADKDWISYEKDLKRVQKLFNELIGTLDFSFEISGQLMEVYRFCSKTTVEALFQRKIDKLDHLISVIDKIKIAFEEVAKQDNSGSLMKNTQTLYAGLTYGKGSLNEVLMNQNETERGFMA